MPQSLYQKYRPTTWSELADQQQVKITLEHEIVRGQLSHAYLFVGPRGVGKTTTARIFAKAVNCQKRGKESADPCGACDSCKRIQAGQSLDLIEVDAASHTGVDHVRERILESVDITAGHGQYRVFIIDEVHMLSTAAFNAMLKVLEEPPAHIIFILATTEVHKVPATIISRCQRFDFKRIPAQAIEERLAGLAKAEGVKVDKEVLVAVAEHADGSLRDAESSFGQLLALGESPLTIEIASLVFPVSQASTVSALMNACFRGDGAEGLRIVNSLTQDGVSIPVFMADCLAWLRRLLLATVTKQLDTFSEQATGEAKEELLRHLGEVSPQRLVAMIDVLVRRRKMLSDLPSPELALELAVVEICGSASPSVESEKGKRVVESGATARSSTSGLKKKPETTVKAAIEETGESQVAESAIEVSVPARGTQAVASELNEQELTGHWAEFLERVKQVNHSLAFVLANVTPVRVASGILEIAVKYDFHRDRLSDPKNKDILNTIATQVLGQSLVVLPVLAEETNV